MKAAAPACLRILHVSEVHWGGVVTLLGHFVEQQVLHGHEVHVLAHPGMPPLHPGAIVHRWELDRARPRSLAGARRELHRLVGALRPDVVHLHSWFAGAVGRTPPSLRGTGGVPVVYQPHAWSDRLSTRPGASFAVRASERLFARHTDVLVANCADELRRGRDLGVRSTGHSLGVAVDLTRFRPPMHAERDEARDLLGFPDDRRVALVLGRLTWQKGQDLLVPAWLAARPPNTTLALVGPGDPVPLALLAGSEAGRSVIMPGGTAEVLPWLWAADVMVLPSRYETVALVVAEAMSTGLPVVATAVDGAEEVLRGGPEDPAGAVAPIDDMEALVGELTRRLDDQALHARESAAGPVRARERFAPHAVAGRLEAAYRDAIERHHAEER